MHFIKGKQYQEISTSLFEFFQDNFKTENEDSNSGYYDFLINEIPHSHFIAVDVHKKAGRFLRRYLVVAIQNGDNNINSPESYSEYLDLLCDLPNPTKGAYNQGIAVILVDDGFRSFSLLLQEELRQVDCGS